MRIAPLIQQARRKVASRAACSACCVTYVNMPRPCPSSSLQCLYTQLQASVVTPHILRLRHSRPGAPSTRCLPRWRCPIPRGKIPLARSPLASDLSARRQREQHCNSCCAAVQSSGNEKNGSQKARVPINCFGTAKEPSFPKRVANGRPSVPYSSSACLCISRG